LSLNTDYVCEWVAAWNRGEVDVLIEGADPDHEWVVAREHPGSTTHRGRDAVAGYLRDWIDTIPDLRIEIAEIKEDGDRVLVVMQMRGTGAGSGAETEVRTAIVTTFRDGIAVRTEEFLDPEEARGALAAD
jgi:ketosteroid isomerase-like protein